MFFFCVFLMKEVGGEKDFMAVNIHGAISCKVFVVVVFFMLVVFLFIFIFMFILSIIFVHSIRSV